MALKIEDGDLSDAEKQLRQAQDRLKEAIERNAPDDEIKRLTQDLKQALDKFLSEMAQKQSREPREQSERGQNNQQSKTVTPEDLDKMIQDMADAMKRGDTAEAQRLMEQLRNILENLQTAERGSRSDQASREMQKQMRDLDAMAQRAAGPARRDLQGRAGAARRPAPAESRAAAAGPAGAAGQPGPAGSEAAGQQGQGQQGQGQQGQGQQGERRRAPAGAPSAAGGARAAHEGERHARRAGPLRCRGRHARGRERPEAGRFRRGGRCPGPCSRRAQARRRGHGAADAGDGRGPGQAKVSRTAASSPGSRVRPAPATTTPSAVRRAAAT